MTSNKKILLVDDEQKIVDVVKSYLQNSGYTVFEAYNGQDALNIFKTHSPSLIILDLMLPDISGEDICAMLRKHSNVPIIMLTSKVEEEDILKGLDLGADDYVTKPFSPKQLVARVAALLRRTQDTVTSSKKIISFDKDELIIDEDHRKVIKNNEILNLTPTEYKILIAMVNHNKKTFTRDELITIALGDDFEGFDRTIDAHIKNLRHKLENNPKSPEYILTVHGVGYTFNQNLL